LRISPQRACPPTPTPVLCRHILTVADNLDAARTAAAIGSGVDDALDLRWRRIHIPFGVAFSI
jgi:hypothetical protein